jgi:hypothetical protein
MSEAKSPKSRTLNVDSYRLAWHEKQFLVFKQRPKGRRRRDCLARCFPHTANDGPAVLARNTGKGPERPRSTCAGFRELCSKSSAKEKGPLATLSVDAFSLLIHGNYQNYLEALSCAFFRQATGSQPACRLQLGLSFQFYCSRNQTLLNL